MEKVPYDRLVNQDSNTAPVAATAGMGKRPKRWRVQKPGHGGGSCPTPVEAAPIPSDERLPVHPTGTSSSLSSVTPPPREK